MHEAGLSGACLHDLDGAAPDPREDVRIDAVRGVASRMERLGLLETFPSARTVFEVLGNLPGQAGMRHGLEIEIAGLIGPVIFLDRIGPLRPLAPGAVEPVQGLDVPAVHVKGRALPAEAERRVLVEEDGLVGHAEDAPLHSGVPVAQILFGQAGHEQAGQAQVAG